MALTLDIGMRIHDGEEVRYICVHNSRSFADAFISYVFAHAILLTLTKEMRNQFSRACCGSVFK